MSAAGAPLFPESEPMPRTEPARFCRADAEPFGSGGPADWLHSRSGRRLRAAYFVPPSAARGSVVLSPGRTEPIEKYGEVIGDLLERRFVVLVHDWAGQGLSERFGDDPLRGDLVGGVDLLLDDYADLLAVYGERLPKPWFAAGHSMGGALTALALCEGETRFAGAALCAPMVEFLAGTLPFWLARRTIKVVNGVGLRAPLARKQLDPVEVTFEKNVLTHDRRRYEQMLALYRAHPELRLGEPTWRWLRFGVEVRDRLQAAGTVERIACPITVIGAGDDRIVNTAATRRFAARLQHGRYVEIPDAFHEILMERDEQRSAFWRAFDDLVERL